MGYKNGAASYRLFKMINEDDQAVDETYLSDKVVIELNQLVEIVAD